MQAGSGSTGAPKLAAARNRGPAPPRPTEQQDRHTQLAGLLLRADLAPDPLERMLAVCRAVFCFLTDLLRGGRDFRDTPAALLGHHYLSKRRLAGRHRGDDMQLYLQELCSHEPLGPTQHSKYSAPPAAAGTGLVAAAAPAPAGPLVQLQVRARPAAAARQQPTGLLAQLGGDDGAPPAWIECSFEGSLTVVLLRHAETYRASLPALVLGMPLAEACPLDFSGVAAVACEATGLAASLRFKPFRGGLVKGVVEALLGEGRQEVASISGSWQGAVHAESPEGAGVLFDGSQLSPLAVPNISLAEPGPRAATRLWAALLESLVCVDPAAAAREGKKAGELVAAVPAHLRRSLLYEVESSGLKPKAAEAEQAQDAAAAPSSDPAAGLLPPCVLSQRGQHGGLSYQLHYRVQAA